MKSHRAVRASLFAICLVGAAAVQSAPASASVGRVAWVAHLAGNRFYTGIGGLGVSPDGTRVYVTGWAPHNSSMDYATAAYDATTGEQLWFAHYDDPMHLSDQARLLKVSPNGSRVFVTGVSRSATGISGWDIATIAYDAMTGARLWVARYDDPRHRDDRPIAMALSPNGSRVFVTGAFPLGRDSVWTTISYSAATGRMLWLTEGGLPGDAGTRLVVSPDGSTLYESAAGQTDAIAAYVARSGKQLWVRRTRLPADWIGISPDGSTLYVAGYMPGRRGVAAAYAVSHGGASREWVARFGRNVTREFSTLSPDGSRIYAATMSSPQPPSEPGPHYLASVSIESATGNKLWTSHHNPLVQDVSGIVQAQDGGRVYAAGSSSSGYEVVGYGAASGTATWTAAYALSADNGVSSIGVSPDGRRVFVAGWSVDTGALTVAFGTS